jgi:hypothetical protein
VRRAGDPSFFDNPKVLWLARQLAWIPSLGVPRADTEIRFRSDLRFGPYRGHRGDGKVFVLDVADALRLKTGERGDQAFGSPLT